MNRGGSEPQRSKGMGGPMGKGMTGMPVVKPKNSMEALKRLWGYLREQRWSLFLVFFLVLASSGFALMGPLLIGKAIDSMGITTGQVQFSLLAKIVGSLIIVYILGALASWLQTYLMASVSQKTVKSMRKDIFDKVQTLPLRFFDERPRGDLMSRLTNDVENINNTLSQATTQIFSSLITVIGAVGMMLMLSPSLTLVSLIVVPLGLFITKKIAERTRKLFLEQQTELGQLNGYIEEMISGQRVVKAFNREQQTIDQFAEKNQRLKKVGAQAQVFSGVIPPLMNAINNLSFALVAGIGGYMAVQGVITIGIITAFLNYSKQFARPLNEMANQINMLQSAFAGAERVFEVLDEEPEFADQAVADSLEQVEGKVEFKDVTFGYKPDKPVLQGINLIAEPGQMIALVGPTGSGKTTIVNLLMRFYDVQQGSVIVDGRDIRQIDKENLRSSIGMVLQDTYLFAGTVIENIRYGRLDATDEQVMYAARMANAHFFIERLPEGYHTKLTEDASNISQGQRQLLTIARAILADPSILILDEATSSIDTRTEMQIQKALKVLMQGRTSFVIAHRLSTIQEADQILVINQGEIIERGNHKELLEQQGFYYNLYHTQFKNQAS
ncbi:ABC transporter ATP-binding protein [Brevibacillus laterosporus]|uniref:ABC transporter ATP-binding protein n=1 Tax=Brevibacillus laterosporus TaxID=1465 RepID=UPI003D1EDEE0